MNNYKIRKNNLINGIDEDQSWVVAYADMITLLFIFFVVLASISKIDRARFESFKEKIAPQQTNLGKVKIELDETIRSNNLTNSIRTHMSEEGLQILISELALFSTGKASISTESEKPLLVITKVLNAHPNYKVSVEGHTDDKPINTAEFSSNWSLSAIRAVNVIHTLEKLGFSTARIKLQAYSSNLPAVSNDTESNRALNRRVVILVY